MTPECPKDHHVRFYNDESKKVNCGDRACVCGECNRPVGEDERKRWGDA